ncbi:alpha/beta-hydrolase [Aspergillus steynii IBT 23096]|uniref:Alpha/beta-hydrolase n=1 Tax=Aspergillus steynii IBT 23096 TaxID=1392250 RepID=A0A2I2G4F3_9EURO|nr:alpha/beta-hydrolase [Aspergillus steynii IBT 23096]PLB47757.1 alpha/beta-hydrolase [Aspergillus steynii IBT 23096]
MNINNRKVSVEVSSLPHKCVQVPKETFAPDVLFALVNEDIQECPDSATNVRFAFIAHKLDSQGDTVVALESVVHQSFLGLDRNTRRLVLKHARGPEGLSQDYHFTLRPEALPIDESDLLITWVQQLAIITGMEENDMLSDLVDIAGKRSNLDDTKIKERIQAMVDDRTIETALQFLGEQFSEGNTPRQINAQSLMCISKLLSIMSDCVYLRDQEYIDDIREKMNASQEAKHNVDEYENMGTLNASKDLVSTINNIQNECVDEGLADKMGLKYLFLSNIAGGERLETDGPICGTFYNDSDNPFIVVVFKGTSSKSDWAANLKYALTPGKNETSLQGSLHSGFLNGLFKPMPIDMITIQLNRLVQSLNKKYPGKKVQIWVTGHSLGGAYATVLWSSLLEIPKIRNSTLRDLITFGAPRVGSLEYAKWVKGIKERRNIWRFVNGRDIVPKVPWRGRLLGDYYHVGSRVAIAAKERWRLQKWETDSNEEYPIPNAEEAAGFSTKIWNSVVGYIARKTRLIFTPHAMFLDHFLENYWEALKDAPDEVWPPPEVAGEETGVD